MRHKHRLLRTVLTVLVILAGTALCLTLATLALRDLSYVRGLQALAAGIAAATLVRLIQGPPRPDEFDDANGTTTLT